MKKWLSALVLGMTVASSAVYAAEEKGTKDETVTIYFARHGKTILNTADRVQGWIDSPLTDAGREVARYLGEGLKGIPFDSFYTSDAGRQRETMEILIEQLNIKDAKVHEDKGLREVFFGGFEGGFNKEMAAGAANALGLKGGAAELFAKMKDGSLDTKDSIDGIAKADPEGAAETFAKVKERTQRALNNMVQAAQRDGNKTILAVSSGSSMQIMISDMTDNPDKNKPLANATIVKITYKDGKYHIDEIGSTKYIEQGMKALKKE